MHQVHQAVIANSMWRTGSTYLAKQFADAPQYKLYYEPCHEVIAKASSISMTRNERINLRNKMRHPQFDGPLIAAFKEKDELTGRPISDLFDPASSFCHVYNDASEKTVEYLTAAARAAEASDQIAFFGFCRSGFQHNSWDNLFEGQHLYLWRDPREQFRSYGWERGNFYFVPAMMSQLLLSKPLAPIVDRLVSPWRTKTVRLILRQVPVRSSISFLRLGRLFAAQLPLERVYSLFYLSWLTSYLSNTNSTELAFSLSELAKDKVLLERLENDYNISISGLRATPKETVEGIDYASAENEVEALVDRFLSATGGFAVEQKKWQAPKALQLIAVISVAEVMALCTPI
jgi:hypothetical protein